MDPRDGPVTAGPLPRPSRRAVRHALDHFVAGTLRPVAAILAVIFLHAAWRHWTTRAQPVQEMLGLYDLAGAVAFVALFVAFSIRRPAGRWAHPCLVAIALYVLVGNLLHLWFFTSATTVLDFILLVFGLGVLLLSIPWFFLLLSLTLLSWVVVAHQVFPSNVFEAFTIGLVQATAISALVFFLRYRTHARLEHLRMRDLRRQALLESALRSVHEADASRSDLLRAIVHDMAVPVTTMKNMLLVTRGGGTGRTDEEKPRRLMAHGLEQLESFLADLRELDEIETGRFAVERRALDLAAVARAAKESYEEAAADKDLDLALRGAEPVPVEGDARHLERVVANLIGNAVKFTDEGRIEVVCRAVDGQAEVVVRDTGRGLAPAETEAVFEPFRRMRHEGEAKVEGSGLGLHICRQIVEAHGGRIEAESAGLGQGATFRMRLPRAARGRPEPEHVRVHGSTARRRA